MNPETKPQPLQIVFPPDFVFKKAGHRLVPAQTVIAPERVDYQFVGMTYPEEGGQLAWFKDCPYPQQGHPFPQAVHALTGPKRTIVRALMALAKKSTLQVIWPFAFLSKKKKAEVIESFLKVIIDPSQRVIGPFFLEEKRYTKFCRELRKMIVNFLKRVKVDVKVAEDFAEVFVTLIEFDNAYRLNLEDAFSETSKEKILKNPTKEIDHIIQVFFDRRVIPNQSQTFFANKFKNAGKLLKLFLLIPFYRKAFYETIKECDFEKLQLDEGDKYHTMLWADHNFQGKTIEQRVKEYEEYHTKHPPFPPRVKVMAP